MWIVYVAVVTGDVEIAAQDDLLSRIAVGVEIAAQATEPLELEPVVLVPDGLAVWNVRGHDPHALYRTGQKPRLAIVATVAGVFTVR